MTDDSPGRQRKRWRLWVSLAVPGILLAVLILPPFLSISRYKTRITQLMSASLGRPVRLSSVELRLLPQPGFVLTDLTVEEDPAYGAEPVLHANTVTASIRLLSLWRGRLEISTISVDEASLNLVRMGPGLWNLDSLFRTAAQARSQAHAPGPRRAVPLPYLEATNSRINFKNGVEKLPYSLVNADLSFSQQDPGEWRIRLRGQPARTDVSLDLADTGVVRLEAVVHRAAELRQMPVHLDLEWREAQLGQLARLVIGSDPGWRGDLTGELHMDGTPDAAQIKTRLRATNVHRAEFAPALPMDFDANCGFRYGYTRHALEDLVCDSPLGDGRIRLAGSRPGDGGSPHFSVELDRIPVAAGLDALRTVRSGFGAGLVARGTVSGKISYAEILSAAPAVAPRTRKTHAKAPPPPPPGPLTGSFTVTGFELSGDGLSGPIRLPRLILEPPSAEPGSPSGQTQPLALAATASVPAGGAVPLTLTARLALSGYQVSVRGQASFARARDLAQLAGLGNRVAMAAFQGDAVALDANAQGPWMVPEKVATDATPQPGNAALPRANPASDSASDQLSGTVILRNASWKADYLANPVAISQATLHLASGSARWDPIAFSYGPVKGTATLDLASSCAVQTQCAPQFQAHFGALDAGALEAAILGAHGPGTLLSTLIARLSPSAPPAWPLLQGTVSADSLILGPATLQKPSATLRILPTGAELTGLDAEILGGHAHGIGKLQAAGSPGAGDKPAYMLAGQFTGLEPAALGQLIGMRWSGGKIDADTHLDLSGFTGKDLAASAKGTLRFEWRHGSVAQAKTPAPVESQLAAGSTSAPVPALLTRFDRWNAEAEIAGGQIALKPDQNLVQKGARRWGIGATVTLAEPPRVVFSAPSETLAAKQ